MGSASAVTAPTNVRSWFPAHIDSPVTCDAASQPAGADTSTEFADDWSGDCTKMNVISDKPNGSSVAGAHLTAVATSDTTQVNWLHCDVGITTPTDASCVSIGSDTSGTQAPGGSGVGDAADEGYDINRDIPSA